MCKECAQARCVRMRSAAQAAPGHHRSVCMQLHSAKTLCNSELHTQFFATRPNREIRCFEMRLACHSVVDAFMKRRSRSTQAQAASQACTCSHPVTVRIPRASCGAPPCPNIPRRAITSPHAWSIRPLYTPHAELPRAAPLAHRPSRHARALEHPIDPVAQCPSSRPRM